MFWEENQDSDSDSTALENEDTCVDHDEFLLAFYSLDCASAFEMYESTNSLSCFDFSFSGNNPEWHSEYPFIPESVANGEKSLTLGHVCVKSCNTCGKKF